VNQQTQRALLLTAALAVLVQTQRVKHPLARAALVVLIHSAVSPPLRLVVAVAQLVMVATQHRQALLVAEAQAQATLSQAQRFPMVVVAVAGYLLILARLVLVLTAAATVD